MGKFYDNPNSLAGILILPRELEQFVFIFYLFNLYFFNRFAWAIIIY